MQERDLYWIAALIDGEGSISLNKHHYNERQDRRSKRGFSWSPKVHIWNNSNDLLEHFRSITGYGHIAPVDYDYPTRLNNKKGYDLTLHINEAHAVLSAIKDLLIVRKKHAQLFLEALDLMKTYQSLGPVRDTTIVRDKRLEAIYWEMRLLNSRGKDGEGKVLAEISKLPSDPRLYTREKFEAEIKATLETKEKRMVETDRRATNKWRREHPDDWRVSQVKAQTKRWEELKAKFEADPEFKRAYYADRKDYWAKKRETPEYKAYQRDWMRKRRAKLKAAA